MMGLLCQFAVLFASGRGIGANRHHTVGDSDRGQPSASGKGTLANGRYAIGDGDRGQPGAILNAETFAAPSNSSMTSRNRYRRDAVDACPKTAADLTKTSSQWQDITACTMCVSVCRCGNACTSDECKDCVDSAIAFEPVPHVIPPHDDDAVNDDGRLDACLREPTDSCSRADCTCSDGEERLEWPSSKGDCYTCPEDPKDPDAADCSNVLSDLYKVAPKGFGCLKRDRIRTRYECEVAADELGMVIIDYSLPYESREATPKARIGGQVTLVDSDKAPDGLHGCYRDDDGKMYFTSGNSKAAGATRAKSIPNGYENICKRESDIKKSCNKPICSAMDMMFAWTDKDGEETVTVTSDASFGPQTYEPVQNAEIIFAYRNDNCTMANGVLTGASLTFVGDPAGKLLLLPRKTGCFFSTGALLAQEAGAIGIVFMDNGKKMGSSYSEDDDGLAGIWRMLAPLRVKPDISIPAVMIQKEMASDLALLLLDDGPAVYASIGCSYTQINAPPGYSPTSCSIPEEYNEDDCGKYTFPDTTYALMDGSVCDKGFEPVISAAECSGAAQSLKGKSADMGSYAGNFGDTTPNTGYGFFNWPNRYPHGCYFRCKGNTDKQLYWNHAGDHSPSKDISRRAICKKDTAVVDPGDSCNSLMSDINLSGTIADGISTMIPSKAFANAAADLSPIGDVEAIGDCVENQINTVVDGPDDVECNAYNKAISCTRAVLGLTKVDKIAMIDITGTLCYAIEETLNVFKAGAAQIDCKICDPFAPPCIDWIEKLFGFSLREVYIVKVIIKGAAKIIGTVGKVLVKFFIGVWEAVSNLFKKVPVIETGDSLCAITDGTSDNGEIIDTKGGTSNIQTCVKNCGRSTSSSITASVATMFAAVAAAALF